MPVYFRKAKPFPGLGGGDCGRVKTTSSKVEINVDKTDVWMGGQKKKKKSGPCAECIRDNQEQLAKATHNPPRGLFTACSSTTEKSFLPQEVSVY